MLLALVALAVLGIAGPARAVPRPAFQVSISYTPSVSDPLQISFSTTVLPGTPTAYDWAFGDGHYLNGSGAGYASPSHRYLAPGSYTVVLTVYEGNASAQQSIVVPITAQPLAVTIQATNRSGPAPLESTFVAVATGGTGTYPSFLWSFGTLGSGSGPTVTYSFVTPGSYRVSINVTDDAGHSAVASLLVNVTAGAAAPPETPAVLDPDLLLGLGLGAIVGAIAGGVVIGRWGARRRGGSTPVEDDRPGPPVLGRSGPSPGAGPSAEIPVTGGAGAWSTTRSGAGTPAGPTDEAPPLGAEAAGAPASAPSGSTAGGAREPLVGPSAPGSVSREALRLSQRIVLHLARQGVLGPNEVAPVAFSQLGMSAELGVRQNALTNVLRRLVAAGVLTEEVRHVRGQPRRLKVYLLTPRGEELARDLRRHRPENRSVGERVPPARKGPAP